MDAAVALRWRRVTRDLSMDTGMLSATELARLARIRDPGAQRCFWLGRVLIHALLGEVLGLPAAEAPVAVDTRGRPGVDLPGVSVSIAHAPSLVVVALGLETAVGVDVEHRRRSPLPAPRRWLSPDEFDELVHRPAHQRHGHLLRIWTGKEAATKALGLGYTMPFRTLEVDADQRRWRTSGAPGISGDVIWPGFVPDHVIALSLLRTTERPKAV
jgi:4'-phosphopantetheinyl transferase